MVDLDKGLQQMLHCTPSGCIDDTKHPVPGFQLPATPGAVLSMFLTHESGRVRQEARLVVLSTSFGVLELSRPADLQCVCTQVHVSGDRAIASIRYPRCLSSPKHAVWLSFCSHCWRACVSAGQPKGTLRPERLPWVPPSAARSLPAPSPTRERWRDGRLTLCVLKVLCVGVLMNIYTYI